MNIKNALTVHPSSIVLFKQDEIDIGIKQMAAEISATIADTFPLVLCPV